MNFQARFCPLWQNLARTLFKTATHVQNTLSLHVNTFCHIWDAPSSTLHVNQHQYCTFQLKMQTSGPEMEETRQN